MSFTNCASQCISVYAYTHIHPAGVYAALSRFWRCICGFPGTFGKFGRVYMRFWKHRYIHWRDWGFCGGNETFIDQPMDSVSLPLHWGGYRGLCGVNVAFLDVSDAFLKCLDTVQRIGKVFGKGQNFDFSMNFRSKKRSWSSSLELPRLARKPNSDWKFCNSAVRRSSELILGLRPCISSPKSRLQKKLYRLE